MDGDTVKIISLAYAGFPGTNQALRNLSRTTRMTRHFSVANVAGGSPELAFFAEHLAELQPALVIFGGWTRAYESVLKALPAETAAGVYWTSSPGQVDISREVGAFGTVLRDSRLRYKFFSSRLLAETLQGSPDCFELPSTFPFPRQAQPHRANPIPIISLFCSPKEYRRKNILNCLLAVAMQPHRCLLYLNGLSEGAEYAGLLADFEIEYKDWGWQERGAYEKILARVDVGLQVSLSESFGYVVTDHVLRGIPVIVSPMVPAFDGMPGSVRKNLVVENPDDAPTLAEKLHHLLDHPTARRSLAVQARRHLLKVNHAYIEQAKTTLQEILHTLG